MRLALLFFILISTSVQAASPGAVREALGRAVRFYHKNAASHGGYVYRYSADFKLREAEGIPAPDTIWIQPPGTPAVGMAFLDAYETTGDQSCLKAAIDAAHAVSRTQLTSGGWDYSGHFDPGDRVQYLYRRDAEGKLIERKKFPQGEAGWHIWRQHENKGNYSTVDDDVTQSAIRLLVRVDHALGGKDGEIHEAADYALDAIMNAQYPAGAWSANFDTWPTATPPADKYPIKPGNYPADWPRKWPKNFTGCYVLNDNTHATLMSTLLLAWQLRKDERCLAAVKRAGDFLLTAQMPDPQPAWGQQYNADMQPVWSRAFEPSSISGRESQAAMWALLKLTAATGEQKYLAAVPRAVNYLRKSLLPKNQVARFYELQTNKPLYFTRGAGGKGFELTYDDDKTSSNYGWKWDSELDAIEAVGRKVAKGEPVVFPRTEKERWSSPPTDQDITTILAELKADGSWTEAKDERGIMRDAEGKKTSPKGGVIYSDTFVQNVRTLSSWLKLNGGKP
ncbi:MAG: pectate lyase [Prosthecobacter sp.]|nr:pectate lyase [Prosthecobacter sp.]